MRNFIWYALFFLGIAFLFQIDFVFYIVYLCVGVYAWSVWYPEYAMRNLKVKRHYAPRAFLGEQVPIELQLTNTRRLPLTWLQFRDVIPVKLRADTNRSQLITINGRTTETFEYQVWAGRRGYYRIGPLHLTVGDQFGFKESVGRSKVDYLTVYPRIMPLEQLGLPSRLPFGTIASKQRLFEDPARPAGVRDYRPGDSLRRINWKASARKESLLVKTLEPAISLETMILLNLNQQDYDRNNRYDGPEWSIIVAASLAAHLVTRRQSIGLATNGVDPLAGQNEEALSFDQDSGRLHFSANEATDELSNAPVGLTPSRGRPALMKLLEILARVEYQERSTPFQQWLSKATLGLGWGTTLLIVTPLADEPICQAIHHLLRAGYNPVLLVTQASHEWATVQERARRLGYPAFLLRNEGDLERWHQPNRG